MKIDKTLLLLIICFSFSLGIFAQTGSIRGFVYDKENGEPIIFTNVYLHKTTFGAATDVNGYYNLTNIPVGNYTLTITYIGYDTLKMAVNIKTNKIINQNLILKKSSIRLKEFVISAERMEMKTEIRTSIVKITPKQLEKIPTMGSEPDLAQYLQVIPGVVFTGDQGGQLYIRGGSPIQNKVLLDGMIVYNPFHSIGLFSVFDSDVIRNADIYTGGFGAEYGGRISSVMDITTKDGNKNRLSGKLSTNTFGSKFLLEGPLKKGLENSNNGASFVFSAKTSYLEESSKLFYSYIDTAGLPFNFTDLYGKVSINGANGTKINLFGFNFNDQVNYQTISDLNWESYGIGSNIILVPSSANALVKANFSYSNYRIGIEELDSKPRYSEVDGFNFGLQFVYFLGTNEFNYGIEALGYNTDYVFYNSTGRKLAQNENTTELGGFLKYKHIAGKLLLEPSFRVHYYASLSDISLEPRLGIKYNISDRLRVKLAAGIYSQNLISANSDRDVVNLFYGFLSGTQDLQEEFDGEEVKHNLQKSHHGILGFEFDLTNRIDINVEGYIKDNVQLTSINRNKIYDDTGENSDKPEYYTKDFIIESGKAYGVDFLLKYDYRKLYLWCVYSLGYVTRYDGVIDYLPHFDRRHNVNLVGSYKFGEDLNWELSARWNLGSGFPFTKTLGYYEKLPFINGITTDYTSENGDLGIIYADLNTGRLPYYHRLDASIKRVLYFGNNSELKITFSITNIYDRENIFYFDRIKHSRVNQLPIMPSLGASFKF
ncbi:MAG: TonB-dependent receptor [Bacteroidetes bacterium]|nr:TonB-dependent receptor [Bacteroidota bacterium]MBT6686665.1 TonB-dependent receptor [Bacteroidota bacterium]MBT7144093.1 TonB-dependent receptor [Bacteroidota bacterium]MBT7492264.1 TonB-dependent receptor [Bacteroidota bacterium]